MKRILFLLLGLAISVVSLYFAFRGFNLDGVWQAMLQMRPLFVALLVIPYILTFMTKVWRWRLLFHPDEDKARQGTLFASLMISYIPLPFRAGEVARAAVAGAKTGIPVARVFSTILVEKVLDVLALLLFLGISLPVIGLPADLQNKALAVAVLVIALALVLVVLVVRPGLARGLASWAEKRLPPSLGSRVESITDEVLLGLSAMSDPGTAVRVGLWSLATWGVNALTIYLMLLAFNLQVTPVAAVVLMVLANLSMVVPSAPGYVGPFELAVVAVLTALGQQVATAQAFAIVYHFIGLVPVATMGVIAAFQQGMGLAIFRSGPDDSTTPARPEPSPAATRQPEPVRNTRDRV